MIKSFANKETAAVFIGEVVRKMPQQVQEAARRKLKLMDAATSLDSLRYPPGNRLEALKGKRAGQWGIRINDQWRICFRWRQRDALDVEIIDYH